MKECIAIEIRASVPVERLDALRSLLAQHHTMERALRWFFSQVPPLSPEDLVAQDEFSYDLLVPYQDGLYLSYDTS